MKEEIMASGKPGMNSVSRLGQTGKHGRDLLLFYSPQGATTINDETIDIFLYSSRIFSSYMLMSSSDKFSNTLNLY